MRKCKSSTVLIRLAESVSLSLSSCNAVESVHFTGTKLLSQCEVYHDNTNSWEPIATLQTCRFALGAAALDKKIYAVGTLLITLHQA